MKWQYVCYIVLVFALSLPFVSFAQETKSFHIDSTGRLFVNPGTPVYLYLSTSPDGKDAVRLQSMQPEGEPMYWDGHGHHYLTHLNLYLGRKIRFDLFADGLPPRTSANFDATEGVQKDDKIYMSGVATLELTARDAHSGVSYINYSINNSDFQIYQEPLVFDSEGEYALRFYAVDMVGNREDEGERIIVVDTTPPVTNLEIEGPQHEEVVSGKSRFVLNATDEVGVRETFYFFNDDSPRRYTRAVPTAPLAEGEHTITWHSVDIVGNQEETQSFTFFVDRTPPMVFEEIVGNTYMVAGREYSSGRSQLRIVAVDNKAGVKAIYYSVNNEPFQIYDRPIFLSEISGAVNIRSYAIDNVGNRGESDAEGQEFTMPEIDITGPVISQSYTGKRVTLRDTLWISPQTRVNISANDKGSGLNRIEYRLNEAPAELYTEPFVVTQSGYHKISITAWDNVENLNIANIEFGVDATAPKIFHNFSVEPYKFDKDEEGGVSVFSEGIILYIAATDDIVGVDRILVSVNGGRERAYSQPLSGFRTGLNTVNLRAVDRLGNEAEQVIRFRVE